MKESLTILQSAPVDWPDDWPETLPDTASVKKQSDTGLEERPENLKEGDQSSIAALDPEVPRPEQLHPEPASAAPAKKRRCESFSQQVVDLLSALQLQYKYYSYNTVSTAKRGWTATKLDNAYRERFSTAEEWWRDLGFESAADAFKSIPEILALKKTIKGTYFVPAPTAAPAPVPAAAEPVGAQDPEIFRLELMFFLTPG